ncbi:hypothetical protein H112_01155 [Trichophyton rubrum D6]|uniref:Uncharacterized protein n=2 Tax=Trichophyton TaxID=5550 RepID=A0A022WEC1_TRIRU|nr:hypothetical protein H100_01148 [Trichophyton rubrum MR850]EZF45850.1 hypothetical protein H102_01145 [Trichophyton rubrum CBS 100081]EZF56443.1 hypothetical protein H103_01152 [Trichophyton rubrum CBS 288.86]EZF67021.1 hypothetical protein H104_01138 [Trichophyton rubrum CBS 289.86]EZF77670.1 hypothetical protein H105_01158 [Trichophyton soudanense CBS 452.61]EZF88364.1 hypothetical protein H110_01155 [Trichophyton rubrum MR1448]EZF99034.1 hypothetical protein H113_01154 [Trichophyton rub
MGWGYIPSTRQTATENHARKAAETSSNYPEDFDRDRLPPFHQLARTPPGDLALSVYLSSLSRSRFLLFCISLVLVRAASGCTGRLLINLTPLLAQESYVHHPTFMFLLTLPLIILSSSFFTW